MHTKTVQTSGPEVKRAQSDEVILRLEIVDKGSDGAGGRDLKVNYYCMNFDADNVAYEQWAIQQILTRILADQFAPARILPEIKISRRLDQRA